MSLVKVKYDGEFWTDSLGFIYGSQDVRRGAGFDYVQPDCSSWHPDDRELVRDKHGSEPYRTNWVKAQLKSAGIAEDNNPVRAQILDEAKQLITGDRNKSYGSPTANFKNTADLWTVQFNHKLKDGERFTAAEVAQAMCQLKLARMIAGSKHDNWADLIGYGACGAECDEASE